MGRQVILSYEDFIYDDYQSVVGMELGIDYFFWATFPQVIKHLSNIKTMEGDYVFLF